MLALGSGSGTGSGFRRWLAMRIWAIFGGVIVLAAVAAFGGALLGQQIELTAKQTRALNTDIDRIIAERHDKNRAFTEVAKAGLPALASAGTSVRETRKVEEQVRKVAANPMPRLAAVDAVDAVEMTVPAETIGSSAEPEIPQAETLAETKAAQVARAQKNAKRRTARLSGPERVIPLAFASLPKFTAHTLLGLR